MAVPISGSHPIPLGCELITHQDLFREALNSLPLPQLYAEISRLENSIHHMERSNLVLQHEAEENGDVDCKAAWDENIKTAERQKERIEVVREEIRKRGGGVECGQKEEQEAPKVNGSAVTNDQVNGQATIEEDEEDGVML